MGDRLTLLVGLARHKPRLSGTSNVELQDGLGSLIELIARDLSLDEARSALSTIGPDVDGMLEGVLTEKTLRTLSTRWDPRRPLGAGVSKGDLVRDLRDLLHERRRPYDPTAPSLHEFRGTGSASSQTRWLADLARFGDRKHVLAVFKKWDPHHPSPPGEVHGLVEHLRTLARGDVAPVRPFNPKPDVLPVFRALPVEVRTQWLTALGEVGTLAQRKAVLKKWDPNCTDPRPDLDGRIRDLGLGRADPMPKSVPPKKKPAKQAVAV